MMFFFIFKKNKHHNICLFHKNHYNFDDILIIIHLKLIKK